MYFRIVLIILFLFSGLFAQREKVKGRDLLPSAKDTINALIEDSITTATTQWRTDIEDSIDVADIEDSIKVGGGDWILKIDIQPEIDSLDIITGTDTFRVAFRQLSGYDNKADSLFNRMNIQPIATRKSNINTLITTLDDSSIWDKLDALWIFAAHDQQAANLNWIEDDHNITEVYNPTWTADTGYTGDGSDAYLRTDFTPDSDGDNFTKDDASLGVYVYDNKSENVNDMGVRHTATTGMSYVSARTTTDVSGGRLNNPTSSAVVSSVTDATGLTAVMRWDADSLAAYHAGEADTATVSTDVLPGKEVYILACNQNNSDEFHTTKTIQAAFLAGYLTPAELLIMETAIDSYLVDITSTTSDYGYGDLQFRMILASDIQVEDQSEFADVAVTIAAINEYTPNVITLAGDIGWPGGYETAPEGKAYYDTLRNYLGDIDSSYYLTSGNHDNDVIQSTSDSNFAAFDSFLIDIDALVDSGGYLNRDTLYATDGFATKGDWTLSYRGVQQLYVSGTDTFWAVFHSHDNNSSAVAIVGGRNTDMCVDADTSWLRETLDDYDRSTSKVIVISHYPTYEYAWYKPDSSMHEFTNFAGVREVLDDFDNVLFVHNGHVHQWKINTSYTIPHIISTRFCSGTSEFGSESPGFYVVDVYENKIVFKAVSTGLGVVGVATQDAYYIYDRTD